MKVLPLFSYRVVFTCMVMGIALLGSMVAGSNVVSSSGAQRVWYRGNVREIIRELESDTDRFKGSLDTALDHSRLNGSRAEDEINGYVKRFEEATDRLRDRAEDREHAPNLAREVLNRGRSINAFMRTHRLGGRAESDWAQVRTDLNRLSNSYYINWRW
ncbi:MAG TPA: hypothetical protein VFB65_05150 [Pyrinomonadaceae bacterium]|nr:hypothetical protein [Pyrinomonadaceae bacterium]